MKKFLLCACLCVGNVFAQQVVVDPVFNVADNGSDAEGAFGGGIGASINNLLPLSADGKLLLCGSFSTYNGKQNGGLARVDSTGAIDASFSVGLGLSGEAFSAAEQSDGKLVVVGNFNGFKFTAFNSILRLNINGTVDASFNAGGEGANGPINDVLLLPNGKMIIAGDFTTYNGVTIGRIARLNTDGTLDGSFNNSGVGANAVIKDIHLNTDGTFLIVGNFTRYNNATDIVRVARLLTDGKLDETYIYDGGASSVINCIVPVAGGKFLVGGNFTTFERKAKSRIVRVNADGSLDESFSLADLDGGVTAIAQQEDGKVWVSGNFTELDESKVKGLLRLLPDGTPDPTFDITGPGVTGGRIASIYLQKNRPILLGSFTAFETTSYGGILRLAASDTPDSLFNRNGGAGGRANNFVAHVLRQPDGKFLVGGDFTRYNGVRRTAVIRLLHDGNLDPTFNTGLNWNNGHVRTMALQSDGKILVAGNITQIQGKTSLGYARLNVDGSLDESFQSISSFSGIATFAVQSFAIQPDGKIIIGGDFEKLNGVAGVNHVARLNTNGSIDETFVSPSLGNIASVNVIARQNDGKILVGGSLLQPDGNPSFLHLVRISANGQIDNSFTPGSFKFGGSVRDIILSSDNKILVAGDFTDYNGVGRVGVFKLNMDGTLDNSFITEEGIHGNNIQQLLELPGGKLLVGGYFTKYGALDRNGLAQLNSNGSVDESFNPGTGFGYTSTQSNSEFMSIVVDAGKLVVGGQFGSFNGVPRVRIARLLLNDATTPVTWLSFTAKNTNGGGLLQWSTASENNNSGFNVQRSTDGVTFTNIGFVAAYANGNNTLQSTYSYTDVQPITGTVYYRIQQIDKDGNTSFSVLRTLELTTSRIAVYPNPTVGNIVLDLGSAIVQKNASISIVDVQGRLVHKRQVVAQKTTINVASLSSGNYVAIIHNGDEIIQQKVSKL